MGRQRKARELMVQALYASALGGKGLDEAVSEQIERRGPTSSTIEYVEKVSRELQRVSAELDREINAALTGWSPERVGVVERAILRLALLEMIYLPETPAKVAISEAVDLAKTYSSDDAARFVNGVLDHILKEHETQAGESVDESAGEKHA
jgi:N utilization substance protein B